MKVTSEKRLTTKDNNPKNTSSNNNNNYGIPDTICQVIINKIISKVVSNSNNDLIYSKINSHCFDFIMNSIDPFLSTDFIFHENHIQTETEMNENQKNNIYFSTIPQDYSNTWVEIFEPDTPELDRYHSERTKIIKEEKRTDSNKENEVNNNINLIDNQEKTDNNNLKRNKNKLNTLKEAIELESHLNSKNDSLDDEVKIIEEKEVKRDNNKTGTRISVVSERKEKARKYTKNLMIDLPCYDLPKEAYENKYIVLNNNEENNLLRLEKEKEIINKEQQKNLELNKNKKEYEKKIKIKLNREFDGNKLTFDSNGNIININIPNIDSFSKEFYITKPTITNLEVKPAGSYLGNEIKNLKNKNNKLKKKEYILNESLITKKSPNLAKKTSPKINYISKLKIVNPSLSLNSILNPKKKIKIEYNPKQKEERKINSKIKIPPSGSNFDQIIPEVGVVIQNDNRNQRKKGGFAYFSKYNKPSVNEYNQLVIETLKLNHQLLSSNLVTTVEKNENKKLDGDKNEYNGYNQEFFDSNNPLIQNAVIPSLNTSKSLIKNNSHFQTTNEQKINNIKLMSNSLDNRKINLKSNNLDKTIKLKKIILEPNLYKYLTKNDDADDNNKGVKEGIFNRDKNNLFKSLKKRSFSNVYKSSDEFIKNKNNSLSYRRRINSLSNKIGSLPNIKTKSINNHNMELIGEDFIDNFNSKILKNKNWGDYIFSERNIMGTIQREFKSSFRKPYKLKKMKEFKELLGTRKRINQAMNIFNEKSKNNDV